MSDSAAFKITPFDQLAAVELAAMTADAISNGDKKSASDATWAKVKFDRQIIAIAKVSGAQTIYSDDGNLTAHAMRAGFSVVATHQLPIPEPDHQLPLLPPNE